MNRSHVRNFCIIAHIDHGKSTLADRLIEMTGTVDKRVARDQLLDQMDLERERGITIKLAPVSMNYTYKNAPYRLHLIDTPGHVDFTYEVSRSLAAVEGAILLVDATQGIEAQTLSNLYLAMAQNLKIIPVINKIDLPGARVDFVREEICKILGVQEEDICAISAKTGEGVQALIEEVIEKIPPPQADEHKPMRALIFDSTFDEYKGVIAYVRVVDGAITKGESLTYLKTGRAADVLEVGEFYPSMRATEKLVSGDIGYIITGLKTIADVHVGDTLAHDATVAALPGYKMMQPMVYASMFAKEGNEYHSLREALEKLSLNDASLVFEPEHSPALGFGFRCGFLGMLHLEVVTERLKREYNLQIVVTVPSVAYRVYLNESGKNAWARKHKAAPGETIAEFVTITSAITLPIEAHIDRIEEPWVSSDIVTPTQYIGKVMEIIAGSRGVFKHTEYVDEERAIISSEMPLASIILDFYDKLKSVTAGYASYHYDILGYREADVIRLDVLVANEEVDALSQIIYKDSSERVGRSIVERLKEILPRQLFEVKIQASVAGRVIASERIAPLRKDVTAKLYGGDVTRKRKLLEKQKKGKKRMRTQGTVDIPQEAYLAILKRD